MQITFDRIEGVNGQLRGVIASSSTLMQTEGT